MAVFTLVQKEGEALHIGLSPDTKPSPILGHTFLAVDTNQLFTNDGNSWRTILNHVTIASLSDFPTPVANVITLANNTTYLINGTVNIGNNRIVCGIANMFKGIDRTNDKLISTTTDAMISCDSTITAKTLVTLENLTLTCSLGSILNLTSIPGNTQNLAIISCTITACITLGILNNVNAVAIRNSAIVGPVSSNGFTITTSSPSTSFFFVRDSSCRNCAGTMFNFGTSKYTQIIFGRNINTILPGQTFLSGTSGGNNVSDVGKLADNIFTGGGTYVSGINSSDPLWLWHDNTGVVNTPENNTGYATTNTDTVTISAGMPVGILSPGVVRAVSSNNSRPAIGLALISSLVSTPILVQTEGTLTLSDWTAVLGTNTLTPNQLYYVDPSNEGKITTTVPTTSGHVLQIIGIGVTSDTLELQITQPILL